jgi:hypothetical protein
MTNLSLRRWSNQFDNPAIISRIRRTIQGRLAAGGCLCVLDDGAIGLNEAARAEIQRGWPASKVVFSNAHASAVRSPREPWRRRRHL